MLMDREKLSLIVLLKLSTGSASFSAESDKITFTFTIFGAISEPTFKYRIVQILVVNSYDLDHAKVVFFHYRRESFFQLFPLRSEP